ncbi:MAG: transcription-repair coupling factor [Bacteroidetes bacterium]|nr:transcription-repair coupling factor [Bacteroidota bacterium]
MNLSEFQQHYAHHPQVEALTLWAASHEPNVKISGLCGSSLSLAAASLFIKVPHIQVFVMNDGDEAAYLYNDLRQILSDERVLFFPSSYKKSIRLSQLDSSNEILRTEVLNHLINSYIPCIIVSYPDAMMQKITSSQGMKTRTIKLKTGENIGLDFLVEMLTEYGFQRVDFVYEPGQFSVRGGIVDIFSFAFELPYRVDFFGDEVESIRVFDIETQLSQEKKQQIEIVPDLHKGDKSTKLVPFTEFVATDTWFHFTDAAFVRDRINQLYDEALVKANSGEKKNENLHSTHITGDEFLQGITDLPLCSLTLHHSLFFRKILI